MKPRWIVVCVVAAYFFLFSGAKAYSEPELPVFDDISGSFAEESIIRLAGQGIITGMGPGEFVPENNVSRIHFAVLVAKTLGIQPFFPSEPTFSDIPPGTVEAGYIEALAKLGLIQGTGDQCFEAENPVLRQDAAVLLHRAFGEEREVLFLDERYIDADRISPYAANSVAYVTGKGWMTGSEGFFYPLQELTRAEAAVLADKLLTLRKGQALTALPKKTTQQVQLRTGETRQIEPRAGEKLLSFTPVYGMDNPGICSISPSDTIVSGKQPGTGTITVNAGYNSYTVKTDVISSKVSDQAFSRGAEKVDSGNVFTAYPLETELDVTYKVEQHAPDSGFQFVEYKNYAGPVDGLTSKSDTWTGFFRQQGRDITVDLKTVRTITNISLEFRQNADWGVYLPNYLKGEVSPDGKCWYQLGYAFHGVSPSDAAEQDVNLTLTFPPVAARYVKLSFPVDVFVFARHLSVKGGVPATGPAILAHAGQDPGLSGPYLQIPGINDILLVYTGDKSEQQTWTSSDFQSVVVYRDNQGNLKGRMFDTILFLTYHGMPGTRDGWAAYAEDLFAPGKQLYALEEAVAKVNEVHGMQVKEKVILTIPYPDPNQRQFGRLEKGGESLSFSEKHVGREQAAKDRFSAVQWYYNKLMSKWNEAGFKHLDLVGIYWFRESVDQTISGERELVQNVARLVRGNNQSFFWIPFFGASGYDDWKSYGFTHVYLQPNYYAKENPPEDRMDRAAELARRYNLGIEVECDDKMLSSRYYYDLFYKQLDKGHQLGFDGNITNAYFAGLNKTLLTAARSNIPQIRAIYDDIYRWISGTYGLTDPQ